eukprot:731987_1
MHNDQTQSTFQAPNSHNISFNVSKNAQPPNRSPKQQQQQQNNQSQQPSTFNISPKKGQNQRQRSSPASTTTTSLNNILATPNNNISNRQSFAQQLTNSKSALALKNVVNKQKRKMKGLPDINESHEEKEKVIFTTTAEIIAPMTIVHGKIRITDRTISFIPDIEQKTDNIKINNGYNLALNPPNLERMPSTPSFTRADTKYGSTRGLDDKYWIAVNVASSYEQVGGTRYKLMNSKNIWLINE